MPAGQPDRWQDYRAAYRAATGFLARRPWEELADTDWFHLVVEIEPHPMVACVMGNAGQEYGLSLFRGSQAESHMRRMQVVKGFDEELTSEASMLSLITESPHRLLPVFLNHARRGGLKAAGRKQMPLLVCKPPHGRMDPAVGNDLLVLWRALAACNYAWDEGWLDPGWHATDTARPVLRVVETPNSGEEGSSQGSRAAGFRVELALDPWADAPAMDAISPHNVLSSEAHKGHQPAGGGDDFDFFATDFDDDEQFAAYADELLERFIESPEHAVFPDGSSARQDAELFLRYLYEYCDMSPAEMGVEEVEEIVFDLVPAKVCMEPDVAGRLVESLRMFFRFLRREYDHGPAELCEQVLGAGAAERLARLLADPRMFGIGKTFFMEGAAAGFDMTTNEGIQAWQEEQNRRFGSGLDGAPAGGLHLHSRVRAAAVESRNARKRARKKARKKPGGRKKGSGFKPGGKK